MAYDFAQYLNIRSALSPVIAPDGERVAFLTDVTGNFQVWSAGARAGRAENGWPQQLTFFENKVWELHGTPAAPHLLAVSDVAGNERQQFYLLSGYGSDPADADDGLTARRLTTDDQAIHRFGAWSRDGRQLVYTANGRNGIDFDYFLLDLASGESRELAQGKGNRWVLAWSPDERFLLVAESVGPLQTELYLFNMQSGQERHLTAAAAPARYGQVSWLEGGIYLLSDRTHDQGAICRLDATSGEVVELFNVGVHGGADAEGELELLCLAPDGHTAAYTINVDGYSRLYLADLQLATRRAIGAECGLPEGVITHLAFDASGGHLACDVQTATANPDIWLIDVAGGAGHRLTFSNRAGIPSCSLVAPALIRYPTHDLRQIPAFFYRPQSEPPAGGYPCILYVHGGPTSQLRPEFDVRFQYFLSRGYAILAPNVRGSSGYGRQYATLDDVEKRMESVADLKHAVLWLQDQAQIDGERVAIYGRSYGGFMVLAALTEYPDLFRAGIDVVGISNWVTFLERTSAWRRSHREKEYGSLLRHRQLLAQISPIHKAGQITAPLLVVAGDNDPRVPLSESEQIVETVSGAGGTVEFIHYADEGHKISKLANRIDSFNRMADFLARYL